MTTRYRDATTKEDITGAFKRAVIMFDGATVNDTVSFPNGFLAQATAQQLADLGVESYEYIPPDPPPTAPPSTDPVDYPLEPFQFFAMLKKLGKTDVVNTAIASISDQDTRHVAEAKFQHMKEFERDDPLFTTLAPAVGLTDAEIDAAWMQAKDIT